MAGENTVNVLQEIPKLRRKGDKLSYDLNGLALSYLRNKTDAIDSRLQAIEEMLSSIYIRMDEIGDKKSHEEREEEISTESPSPRRRKASPLDSLDGTFVPSRRALESTHSEEDRGKDEIPLPWLKKLYLELFHPEKLRRNPPFPEEQS